MNIELFTTFILITIVLIIAPGPIVTLIISTGVLQGRRAALITVAGTTLGNALLLAAIASALGWVHAHADILFNALRWTGAAYLIWLGIQAWRHAGESDATVLETGRARFVRGILLRFPIRRRSSSSPPSCRNSLIPGSRRDPSSSRCASPRLSSLALPIAPGRSRRAWVAHGS